VDSIPSEANALWFAEMFDVWSIISEIGEGARISILVLYEVIGQVPIVIGDAAEVLRMEDDMEKPQSLSGMGLCIGEKLDI
jgi:hypothetical protein